MAEETGAGMVGFSKDLSLLVDHGQCEDCSIISLMPSMMEELMLFKGDFVTVKGKFGKETVCTVLESDKWSADHVLLNETVRKSLRVNLGDIVTISPLKKIENGKTIHVVPVGNIIEDDTDTLLDVYLKPYFLEAFRPVKNGNFFLVRHDMKPVEFKVVWTDPQDMCIVAPETVIMCEGQPIKPDNMENGFIVDEATIDDNSAVYLNSVAMEYLKIYHGDVVAIKGDSGQETVGIAFQDDDCENHLVVRLNNAARKNLSVGPGDLVTINLVENIEYGKIILVLPIDDTIESVNLNGKLLNGYLKPYFSEAYLPVKKGDLFVVHHNMKPVEFKVVDTYPADTCIVAPETVIVCDGELY